MTKFDATENLANFSLSDDSVYNWRTNIDSLFHLGLLQRESNTSNPND